ncbi:MAG TPA: BTAD domain-containing putative transcriptional regulator [Natronosporangium sp.]
MEFRILGPIEAEIGGQRLPLARPRERCLLGVLLLEANRVVPVDRLAELLWSDQPPKRVRNTIQGCASRLRATLSGVNRAPNGADGTRVELVYAGNGYQLRLDPQSVDAFRFQELLRRAAAEPAPAERVELLRAALDLWRGPALSGVLSGPARERLAASLEEQRLTAVEELAAACLELRRGREVLPTLARFANEHPGRERLAALHMRALQQAGRRADALAVYARTRGFLVDQLGIEPGLELRNVHKVVLRDEPAGPPAAGSPAAAGLAGPPARQFIPRQLPADLPAFTGRRAELARLDQLLPAAARAAVTVVVTGTAGVGKSTLALHWAHRVANAFPDGQLYLNLRGFDPAAAPTGPAEAIRSLLDGLQVPSSQLPANLDAQVGLYRSLLTGRRMLVVLDNARDAEQVRPLLPPSPGCVALITSRNQFSGLAATAGAQLVRLDLFTPDEAEQFLTRRLGPARAATDPAAVRELVARCARLPLALAVVAARAVANPAVPLRLLADELTDPDGGLAEWTGSDPSTDLRAVLSSSYRVLDPAAARLFRLLGGHPGPEFTAAAAASLAGIEPAAARRLLTGLAEASLLAEPSLDRYSMHDLLRAFAAELADSAEPAADRRAARHRLLDHYLQAVAAAISLVEPHRTMPELPDPQPGVSREPLGSADQARAWLIAERSVLANLTAAAAGAGFDAYAVQLGLLLCMFFNARGYRHESDTVGAAALAAAERLDDRYAQAQAHRMLGIADAQRRRWQAAEQHLRLALAGLASLGRPAEQAAVHMTLGAIAERRAGDFHTTCQHADRALELARRAGDQVGIGRALNQLGWARLNLGDPRAAIRYGEQALAIQGAHGDLAGVANTLDTLGRAHHQLGDLKRAIATYREALDYYDRSDAQLSRAETLERLGDAYLEIADLAACRTAWQEAAGLLAELDEEAAGALRRRLAGLPAG